jgi:hypothetical protein
MFLSVPSASLETDFSKLNGLARRERNKVDDITNH